MAGFMDLNISYTTDKNDFRVLLQQQRTVTICHVVDLQQKKQGIGKPKCVSELYDTFSVVQGKSRTIKFKHLLTVFILHDCFQITTSVPSQRPTAEYKAYDLVAVYLKTEKLFHITCMTFDVDIICVAVTEKQPLFFKRSPVNGVCMNTTWFSSLFIVTKGLLFGLSEGDGKSAISTNCHSVHLHGETRKTALGIVHTMKKDQPLTERQEDVPASKRDRIETSIVERKILSNE
uniref:Uncharacterized protein n=1 Tax=Hucho hucho TaxID=62062 RepID=A0A4W5MA84_9TELE